MRSQIFAIFCALSLAQALVIQAKPNDLQAAEVRGIADEAEKVFKELMAAVDKALDDASASLNAAVKAVNQTVTDLEGKAHDAINLAMDPINAKLKELIENAEKLGINTTKCEKYIDELTDLPNKLNDEVVECMTDGLYKAVGYADDVLDNIQVIEQDMANFTNRIKDCEGSIWSEIKCLGLLTAEMTKDSVAVPVKIAADVAKTDLLIKGLIPKVTLCYTTAVAQVPIRGLALVGKFALCTGQQDASMY
ncbi:unnamed protein product [Ceutorhynchus assimilis]|uniref:Uncharacterized protein n=1 Tax=Ceutorhynchus assimilis TaxID=467358 RepID=A0A9N9MEB6_9CUCU|nr:unnamed protein product [Ceutorhynchus assimilis]